MAMMTLRLPFFEKKRNLKVEEYESQKLPCWNVIPEPMILPPVPGSMLSCTDSLLLAIKTAPRIVLQPSTVLSPPASPLKPHVVLPTRSPIVLPPSPMRSSIVLPPSPILSPLLSPKSPMGLPTSTPRSSRVKLPPLSELRPPVVMSLSKNALRNSKSIPKTPASVPIPRAPLLNLKMRVPQTVRLPSQAAIIFPDPIPLRFLPRAGTEWKPLEVSDSLSPIMRATVFMTFDNTVTADQISATVRTINTSVSELQKHRKNTLRSLIEIDRMDAERFETCLSIYENNQVYYQDLLDSAVGIERDSIIKDLNILERWFISIVEPRPKIRAEIKQWEERENIKKIKGYSAYCDPDLYSIITPILSPL